MKRKIVKVTEAKTLEVFTETMPEPGPHEIVIRITISGICHSEMPTYLGEGSMMMKGPLVFHPLINSTFWRAMYQQLFLLIHQCHQDCISNGTQSVLHLFLQNICRYDS